MHTYIRSICKAHEKQKSHYAPTSCGKKQRAVVTAVQVSTYWSMMPEFDSVTEVWIELLLLPIDVRVTS